MWWWFHFYLTCLFSIWNNIRGIQTRTHSCAKLLSDRISLTVLKRIQKRKVVGSYAEWYQFLWICTLKICCVFFFIGGIYSIARTNMITIIKRSWARVRNDNDDEMIYMGVGSCLLLNKFSFIIFLFYDIPSDACFVNILHRVNGQQNNSRLGETTQAIIKIINQSCMIFCREREIEKGARKKTNG